MGKLWRRLHHFLNRARLERELAQEMQAHREMMPADRRARFGRVTRITEDSRETWSWRWLDQLIQDLAYGARVLWRSPGFTLGAVAVVALGVGANLADFAIFDTMIFHRLTIRDAALCLRLTHAGREGPRLGFTSGAVDLYRAQSKSFRWLVAEDWTGVGNVNGDPGQRANLVSPDYFPRLGVLPAWGRLLDERDSAPGAPAVAVLGYDYWQTRWGGDPNVIGRAIRVDSRLVEIVGVLPYTFSGLSRGAAIWMPIHSPGDFSRTAQALFGVLMPGVSRVAAESELTAMTRAIAQMHPGSFAADEVIHSELLQDSVLGAIRRSPPVALFMLLVLLVLLSACANLGNMLLARGLSRQREIEIRASIGASRGRIVRQLMTENLLLAILGGVGGVTCGAVLARVMVRALGAPPGFQVEVRWPVVAAGFVLAILSTLAFGLPAALRTARPTANKTHLRQGLVGVQVAVSCLLLIAAGVLAHNGVASASVHLTFDYRNMIVASPQLYGRNYGAAAARQKLLALTERMRSLPAVTGVTAAVIPPLSGRLRMETPPGLPHLYKNSVAVSYFAAMNLPTLRGRVFAESEPGAIVLSDSAARAMWPTQNPIGKTLTVSGAMRTVVGVVKDSGANLLADADSVEVYLPFESGDWATAAIILHTNADPSADARLIPAMAATEEEIVAVTLMRTSRENLLLGQARAITLFGAMGAIASTLAATGMFALVAFAVAQRRRELGIRIAIGATPRHVLRILLAQNARAMAAGTAVGVVLAAVLARVVRSRIALSGQDPVDPLGFVIGIACFAVIAGLATLSPAMRALRIDPSVTLREE